MEYEPPILDGHAPFFLDVHQCQVDRLLSSQVIGELDFGFDILTDTPVDVLNGIGRIDNLADFQRESKIAGQVFPVITPGQNRMFILGLPFTGEALQGMLGGILIGSGIDFLKVHTEFLTILPDHVFAAITDLVNDAQLGDRVRKHAFNGVCEAL